MSSASVIVGAYAIAMVLFAVWARRDLGDDDESYFLAGRSLSGPILLVTMAATNFSAFTVYGSSGVSYRGGLSFLPIMAFGTGFMAVSLYLLGKKVRIRSAEHGAMTAPELILGQTGSKEAQFTMATVLILATIPYLALQPRAAGIAVSALFGVEDWVGAVLVTILVVAYTLTGGLKAVVRTDAAQGAIALGLLWLGLAMVISDAGGLESAMNSLADSEEKSWLLSREGGKYTLLVWTSMMLLWLLADPMFPQLFQRLCAADSEEAIGRMATLYPAVAWLAFIPPILIGTLGHLDYPELSRGESDDILPMLIVDAGGEWLGGLVVVAGLAALMSTMDSQLLATGSLFTRDILQSESKDGFGSRQGVIIGLSLLGLMLSLWSNVTILELGMLAFAMYAVIFPSVFIASYSDSLDGRAVIASIVAGELVVLLAIFSPGSFEGWWVRPVGPAMATVVLPSLAAALLALAVGQYAFAPENRRIGELGVDFSIGPHMLGLVAVFVLAQDFWWWEEKGLALGLPIWIWWAVILSVVQTAIMANWTGKEDPR